MSPPSLSTRLTLVALLSASTFYFLYKSRRLKLSLLNPNPNPKPTLSPSKPKLFFLSQTGTSKTLAHRLHSLLTLNDLSFDLVDPQNYEPEDLAKETLVLIIASTWEDGKPPQNSKFFASWLAESADDFRVGSLLLSECKFAVFGVGSRVYGGSYNAVARDLSKKMKGLGGEEILKVGEGDVDGGDLDGEFEDWCKKVVAVLKGDNVVENGGVLENGIGGESDYESEEEEEEDGGESEVVDLEDIAGKAPSRRNAATVAETNGKVDGKRNMVTPVIRASLEKQVARVGDLLSLNELGALFLVSHLNKYVL